MTQDQRDSCLKVANGANMVRLIDSQNNQRCNRWRIFGLFGTLSVAALAPACGENTERVISKVPVVYIATGGSSGAASTVSDAGGNSSVQSGGSAASGGATGATGGSSSESIGTGGSSTAGASSLPPMRAVGDPIGYAAQGSGGTTGGGVQVPDRVTECGRLSDLLADPSSRVIVVDGPIDCTKPPKIVRTCEIACDSTTGDTKTIHRWIDDTTADCSGIEGASAATPIVSTWTSNNLPISVASNKTLLGTGPTSIISGASLYLGAGVSNVIIQNLVLTNVNPQLVEAGDAITIDYGAHHVWVDHCTFSLISDGFIDTPNPSTATSTATNITLSWNHFDGHNSASCAGQHNYANTIENSTVTFHHNWWDSTLSCSPKITKASAKVHLFNNYWSNVKYYSIGVDKGAQALIEFNDFDNSNRPYWGLNKCLDTANCGMSDSSGSNQFEGISTDPAESKNTGGAALVALPPYTLNSSQLEPASNVKDDVNQNVGPTLTIP